MEQLQSKVQQLQEQNKQMEKKIEDISNENLAFKDVVKEAFGLIHKLQAEQKQLVQEIKANKDQVVVI